MSGRVRNPPLLVNHKLGRLTCSGNGLLLDDLPYEPIVDCYQAENVSRGNMGPTATKLAVQCKFRGQPHNGDKALLLARLRGRDNEMTQEFLQLKRMMNREFHLRQQSLNQTELDEQAEVDLRERFLNNAANQAEDHIEQCYDTSIHLNALQRASDSLGLIIQSTQGPKDVSDDKHHIVIGRRRSIVSKRIQEINLVLYSGQTATQHFLPLGNLAPSPGSPTGGVVAIIDPNPPYAIAGKWLLQNPSMGPATYTLRIWNSELPGDQRQIYCKLELNDHDTYLLRLINPSISNIHPTDLLAAFPIPASKSPSAALPNWNLLWRSRGVNTNMGSMTFSGEFGFLIEVRLKVERGDRRESELVLRGYKSGEADGVEMNIEVEWARLR